MNVRNSGNPAIVGLSRGLGWFNARHPWSHNDHFHRWIMTRLPAQRSRALDVGCGHGGLVARLAGSFDTVHGIDIDSTMRKSAQRATRALPNVSITADWLEDVGGPYDLVAMIAVLHHLDTTQALARVRELLAPGGKFLVVGLARPQSPTDYAWDIASAVANPVIGLCKHPRPVTSGPVGPPFPVRDPEMPIAELRTAFEAHMPGTTIRRRLGFRYTAEWTKPPTAV